MPMPAAVGGTIRLAVSFADGHETSLDLATLAQTDRHPQGCLAQKSSSKATVPVTATW